jgi:hypothetical protein
MILLFLMRLVNCEGMNGVRKETKQREEGEKEMNELVQKKNNE